MKALAKGSLLVVAAGGLSCGAILGIEDAEVDPALTAAPGGASGAGGQGGTTSAGGGGEPSVCERYCDTVMATCTGVFAVYTTIESCLAVCGHLPPGREGDEIGNTAHCRLRHAESAPAEPAYYCPIAGPGGNGVCGSNCEGLCTIAEGVCVGATEQWSSRIACQDECSAVPDLGTYSTDPSESFYEGDHVQCRLFHVSSAALMDAAIHCPHVAGAPPCAAASSTR